MEIRITDAPIETGRTVNIEMAERLVTLDFRKDGALGALVEFRVVGNELRITVESAAAGSEPQTIEVELSGSGHNAPNGAEEEAQ